MILYSERPIRPVATHYLMCSEKLMYGVGSLPSPACYVTKSIMTYGNSFSELRRCRVLRTGWLFLSSAATLGLYRLALFPPNINMINSIQYSYPIHLPPAMFMFLEWLRILHGNLTESLNYLLCIE